MKMGRFAYHCISNVQKIKGANTQLYRCVKTLFQLWALVTPFQLKAPSIRKYTLSIGTVVVDNLSEEGDLANLRVTGITWFGKYEGGC